MKLTTFAGRILFPLLLLLAGCVVTSPRYAAAPTYGAPAGTNIAAGTRVAAIWKDGKYYPGTVASVRADGYAIAYDDGDQWIAPLDGVVPMAGPGALQLGSHVLGVWKNGKMYPGKITQVSPGGATIAWDDGDAPMFVPEKNIAPIGGQTTGTLTAPATNAPPQKSYPGLQLGTRVAAKWTDGKYWLGEIAGGQGNQYVIHYADGDQATIRDDEVIPIAAPGTLVVGQHVLAVWQGAKMYPGTITSMDAVSAVVKWDDGDAPLAVPLDKIAPY